jgi:hypothetical protein
VPVIRIAPQHQLIAFVVERLRVPWRSEPAGEARPVIITIAIDHGATRSQLAAVVEWPSSRKSVTRQRCLRCMTGVRLITREVCMSDPARVQGLVPEPPATPPRDLTQIVGKARRSGALCDAESISWN